MTAEPKLTGRASSYPPIADYGFLSDCEVMALVAPSGNVEWLCLPRVDSPERVRRRARPPRRRVPARPGRRQGAGRPALPAGHDDPRDELGHADGLDHRARPLLIGPWHHEDELSETPPPGAHRLRRRPRAAAHRPLRQRRGAGVARLRAGVRLRPGAGPVDATPARVTTTPSPRAEGVDLELRLTTDMRLGFEGGRATARTLLKEGDTRFVRAVVERARAAARPSTSAYRRLVWTAHHWQHWLARGTSPTTPGAATSSAAP